MVEPPDAARTEAGERKADDSPRQAVPQGLRSAWLPPAVFALFAVLASWPLVTHLGSALPQGSESSGTVPLFNLWTLEWNAVQLAEGYATYWDAPIFHPVTGTFAFSDPQPLTGVVFALLRWLVGSGVVAYNLVVLTALWLNGWSAFRLVEAIGLTRGAAFLAGGFAVCLPYVAEEQGVLQLLMLFPLFFSLGAIEALARAPSWRVGAELGLWLAVTALTSSYYAVYSMLLLPLVALIRIGGRSLITRSRVSAMVLAGVVAGALVAVPVTGQLRHQGGEARSLRSVLKSAGHPGDFIHLAPPTWGAKWSPWLSVRVEGAKHDLYPGTGLLVLGLCGLVAAKRDRRFRRWGQAAGAGALAAAVLVVAPRIELLDFRPWEWVRDVVPGLSRMRNSHRFGAYLDCFLVVSSGLGATWLWAKGRSARIGLCAIALYGLLEVQAWPIKLHHLGRHAPDEEWIELVAERPGPVAMIPFARPGKSKYYEQTVRWMFSTLAHRQPLLNGYSGYFPPSHRELRRTALSFPQSPAIRALREAGARTLVVDRKWLESEPQRNVDLAKAIQFDGLTVVAVGPSYLVLGFREATGS